MGLDWLGTCFDNWIQRATDWHHKASLANIYKRREQEATDHMGGAWWVLKNNMKVSSHLSCSNVKIQTQRDLKAHNFLKQVIYLPFQKRKPSSLLSDDDWAFKGREHCVLRGEAKVLFFRGCQLTRNGVLAQRGARCSKSRTFSVCG